MFCNAGPRCELYYSPHIPGAHSSVSVTRLIHHSKALFTLIEHHIPGAHSSVSVTRLIHHSKALFTLIEHHIPGTHSSVSVTWLIHHSKALLTLIEHHIPGAPNPSREPRSRHPHLPHSSSQSLQGTSLPSTTSTPIPPPNPSREPRSRHPHLPPSSSGSLQGTSLPSPTSTPIPPPNPSREPRSRHPHLPPFLLPIPPGSLAPVTHIYPISPPEAVMELYNQWFRDIPFNESISEFESSEFQSYHVESGTLNISQWHIGHFFCWGPMFLLQDYVFAAELLLTHLNVNRNLTLWTFF